VSPIAYSLREAAANDLVDDIHNAYSIILITDGGESCGGDICNVVQTLLERKIFFKPYIISMVDYVPLRNQYACLGSYLQVSKENEMGPAISTIVAAYRPLLVLPIMTHTKQVTAVTPAPAVRTIDIPAWIPAPTTAMGSLPIIVRSGAMPVFHYTPLLRKLRVPPMPAFARLEREPEVISTLPPKKDPPPLATATPPVIRPETVAAPAVIPAPPKPKPTPPAKDTAKTSVVVKALPPVAKTGAKPLPVKPGTSKPKEATFTTSTEDAKETTVEIYFTDGHGKFYRTTPQLQLNDPKTGKTVKQFFRTTDPMGNPDPQQLPAGTYNLVITGRSNTLMRNMVIQENKKNKILVVVTNGSLIFRYEDAPERPVDEFDAIVNIRFEPGPTVKQRCSSELEYAPGNYYIEMNTLPVTRFNADIEFGSQTIVTLKQPGYVQVMNTNAVGKVSFYHQLGDRYVRFYGLDITGRPDDQKLRLQPGPYEIRWVKNPAMPYASESVQRFSVQPNMMTQIEVH
jgi:hypothetical protein